MRHMVEVIKTPLIVQNVFFIVQKRPRVAVKRKDVENFSKWNLSKIHNSAFKLRQFASEI